MRRAGLMGSSTSWGKTSFYPKHLHVGAPGTRPKWAPSRYAGSKGLARSASRCKHLQPLVLSYLLEVISDRLFNVLGAGGQVQMPMGKTFFSPRFRGSLRGLVDNRHHAGELSQAVHRAERIRNGKCLTPTWKKETENDLHRRVHRRGADRQQGRLCGPCHRLGTPDPGARGHSYGRKLERRRTGGHGRLHRWLRRAGPVGEEGGLPGPGPAHGRQV